LGIALMSTSFTGYLSICIPSSPPVPNPIPDVGARLYGFGCLAG
jgi:hypothetical protein